MRIDLQERQKRSACFVSLSFAGLVVLARSLNPIPSRTRPLNSSAPMVLWLKPWGSSSLPGLPRTKQFLFTCHDRTKRRLSSAWLCARGGGVFVCDRPVDARFSATIGRHHQGGSEGERAGRGGGQEKRLCRLRRIQRRRRQYQRGAWGVRSRDQEICGPRNRNQGADRPGPGRQEDAGERQEGSARRP